MTTAEEYVRKVKTGQDLIDLKVVPKDSSAHLALITRERLVALRDKIEPQVTPDMTGSWLPAVKKIGKEYRGEVSDPDIIARLGQDGMRVEATGVQDGTDLKGLTGIIKGWTGRRKQVLVEFDSEIKGGHDCKGLTKPGRGYQVDATNLRIALFPGEVLVDAKDYDLGKEVVAHENIGHLLRVGKKLDGVNTWDTNGNAESVALPEDLRGKLTAYDKKSKLVTVRFDAVVPGTRKQIYSFKLGDVADNFQTSSLGQIEPQEKEAMVRDKCFSAFFPTTELSVKRSARTIVSLLMGKDTIFYGPPGGGKSQIVRDIIEIAKQQGVSFVVKGCKANCSPFSLFDKDFARSVPACPECMIRHCAEFKDTGRFVLPRPRDVEVGVMNYSEGRGIEFLQGTSSIQQMHLVGYKLPGEISGKPGVDLSDDSNPEGFMPGALVRTNNGVLHADEMDKWRPQALDVLLEALNSGRVKPDQLRYAFPAHSLVLGTANDQTKFSGPLNDRMALLAMRYSESVDVRYRVTKKAYHGEVSLAGETPIGDTHLMPNRILRSVPMPVIIEQAVDAFYMKLENEFTGKGKNMYSPSNRSKMDALDAARASLLLDRIFFNNTSEIAGIDYTVAGIKFALCGRVQIPNREEEKQAKKELVEYLVKEFPAIVKQEENTWWCEAYRKAGIRDRQVSGIVSNFIREMGLYDSDVKNAERVFEQVRSAREPNALINAQKARIEYPFMDYLFGEQPRMNSFSKEQVNGLMKYFLESRKNTTCKIE